MLNRILCILLALSAALWAPAALASSPSEPAYSSQLRSCFEANRPTEAMRNMQSWLNAGKSVYSSYPLAASVSKNCMRSVCGSNNGMCCTTYCTMYGLTGNEHSTCFRQCSNPYGN